MNTEPSYTLIEGACVDSYGLNCYGIYVDCVVMEELAYCLFFDISAPE